MNKTSLSFTDQIHSLRSQMKYSRAKIWVRTGLLTIFSILFGTYLVHDMSAGIFHWQWGTAVLALCFPSACG